MWSYIVIFTQLYLGFVPWECNWVSQMVRIIGPLPKQWKGHYNAFGSCNDSWYDQDNKPHRSETLGTMVMRARPDISATELNHVLSIMSKDFPISRRIVYLQHSFCRTLHLKPSWIFIVVKDMIYFLSLIFLWTMWSFTYII